MQTILSHVQRRRLRAALAGTFVACSFGAGVDSTAMLVALHAAGIRPDVITFADTGAEKRPTLEHLVRMNSVLASWGWPLVTVCKKIPLASTGYLDLYGNCMKNQTLPSLAFGLKSCSIKWKQVVQDQFIKGALKGPNKCDPHPIWREYQITGRRISKLIGYDAGPADVRRSKKLPLADVDFNYCYPLQIIGWTRSDCVNAIAATLGEDMVPIKSACFMCPASKIWELYWLAANDPELLERALLLERNALTGRHSRFDEVEFGASWLDMVENAERFPSTSTTVGLGRDFAWNQWARVNDVVDTNFVVHRDPVAQHRFADMADLLRRDDNALDRRTIKILPVTQQPHMV
jgi:hypothetical protein